MLRLLSASLLLLPAFLAYSQPVQETAKSPLVGNLEAMVTCKSFESYADTERLLKLSGAVLKVDQDGMRAYDAKGLGLVVFGKPLLGFEFFGALQSDMLAVGVTVAGTKAEIAKFAKKSPTKNINYALQSEKKGGTRVVCTLGGNHD